MTWTVSRCWGVMRQLVLVERNSAVGFSPDGPVAMEEVGNLERGAKCMYIEKRSMMVSRMELP